MKFIFVALTLFMGLQTSCILKGTNTGNPDKKQADSPNVLLGPTSLALGVCVKLTNCIPVSQILACQSALMRSRDSTRELGSVAERFLTMEELELAEVRNEVVVRDSARRLCLWNLDQMACDNELIVRSYSAEKPDDYGAVASLFRVHPSCAEIFELKSDPMNSSREE